MKARSPLLVAAFIIALFFAAEDSTAQPYIELGQMVKQSSATAGGIGYVHNDKWDVNATFAGDDVRHGKMRIYSVSRVFRPAWLNAKTFMGVGVSKVITSTDKRLVDPYNFKLRAGIKIGKSAEVSFSHGSSAHINNKNSGINLISLRLYL